MMFFLYKYYFYMSRIYVMEILCIYTDRMCIMHESAMHTSFAKNADVAISNQMCKYFMHLAWSIELGQNIGAQYK